MGRFLVSCTIVVIVTASAVWSQPDVYVIDRSGGKRPIAVVPREQPHRVTVDIFAYLYLPSYASYSPLEGVRVWNASLDGSQSGPLLNNITDTNGFARIVLQPYEPVNLLFQFDKALRIGTGSEVDHLMPLSTFLAGRPGQAMSLHVAMATVSDIMTNYGPRAFKELYDLAKLAVGNRPELLAGAWQDVVSICEETDADELIENLTERYGNELRLVCSDIELEVHPVAVPGNTFQECEDCPLMVVVPAGKFIMGSPESEWGRLPQEGPRRRVTIGTPFAVGVYEVTFAEWDACVRDDGCNWDPPDEGWGRDRRPVINVSWEDAQQYVRWLSQLTGGQYRLLSEAEWEYVARAAPDELPNQATPFHFGYTISTDQANYDGRYRYGYNSVGAGLFRQRTIEVGSFPANSFGLHDVAGNVAEWTQDCENDSYLGAPSDGSAWEEGDCEVRRARGGSWREQPWALRSAIRTIRDPESRDYITGFRVARVLSP